MNVQRVERGAARATIGAELERMRLEQRAQRLEHVVQRLRQRAQAAEAGPRDRPGLRRTVADFAAELARLRARLGRRATDV